MCGLVYPHQRDNCNDVGSVGAIEKCAQVFGCQIHVQTNMIGSPLEMSVTHAEATKIVEKNLTREFAKGGWIQMERKIVEVPQMWRFHRCVLVSTQHQVPTVQAGQKAVSFLSD